MTSKVNPISYLLSTTFKQAALIPFNVVDFIMPDLTILTPLRALYASLFWKIHPSVRLRKNLRATQIGNIVIGKNCFINMNNFFDNNAKVDIGDDCSIGFDNKFMTINHIEKDKVREGNKNSYYSREIKVGKNVWITTNCVILAGSDIGDNCIITPNSVVKGKLESNGVYEGNPATRIRETKGIIPKSI